MWITKNYSNLAVNGNIKIICVDRMLSNFIADATHSDELPLSL